MSTKSLLPDGSVASTVHTLTPPDSPHDKPSSLPFLHLPWRQIAIAKREAREANLRLAPFNNWRIPDPIPEDVKDVSSLVLSNLSPLELEIVHLDATAIVERIRDRCLSSVQVTTAFCKVAAVAQDLTNCLTEIFFDQALKRAAELDDHLERTGQIVGPLHGLPVSVKDHILLKGQDTSTGYISWANKTIATKDAVAVDLLRRAGAVLYVKSANPQTLLSLETENNIYGRTLNPHNRSLTCGGSSGGEGALIGARGSPLGIGTDIGGSVRVPAAHCGIYGLKGSVARFPHAGLLGSHNGMEAIVGVLGPMSSSARDLALWCRVMLQYEPWYIEPPLLNMPWKEEVARGVGLPAKSTFAIMWDDGVVLPHPPIRDALRKTKASLLAAGHQVVNWTAVGHQQAWDLITKLYLLDAGSEYLDSLADSGEPAVEMTQWMLGHATGRQPYTPAECFELNVEREAFRSKIMTLWNQIASNTSSGKLDAILCPIAPTLAPAHGTTRWWGYSSYWNLLDYPGVVFPVGKFCAREYQAVQISHPHRNSTEAYVFNQWSPETFDGAPISLQLIGRRHEEEKLLAMLSRVEDARKNHPELDSSKRGK